MPKYDEHKVKKRLKDGLIKAATQEITVDEACKIAQSLALLEIADDISSIRLYLSCMSDFVESMQVDIGNISRNMDD